MANVIIAHYRISFKYEGVKYYDYLSTVLGNIKKEKH